jgi:hypothetical protein
MPSVIMLSVAFHVIVMLNVVTLSVIMPNVVPPLKFIENFVTLKLPF